MFAAQCEILTERPLVPLLPLDFQARLNIGDIDMSMIDTITLQGNVDMNANVDFTPWFRSKANEFNKITTDLTDQTNVLL